VNIETKNKNVSSLGILKRIIPHLEKERKKDVLVVFFLSIFSCLAESISIAMLIPFISFFVNPDNYLFNNLFEFFFEFFNIIEKKDILLTVSLGFIFIVSLSGLIRLKYIKYSNSLSDNVTSDFQIKIFKFLTNQNYSYYIKHGSNEIMSSLAQKSGAFNGIIFSSLNIVNSILIILAITAILTINEPVFTPLIIISTFLFFFVIFKIKSSTVLKRGQNINSNQDRMIDIFQNTVGYLPEIIIYNLKQFFIKTLSKVSKETARAVTENRITASTPKIYLETFIIIFVVLIIYITDLSERSIESNISYFAILAFGAQKSLPLINSIYQMSINFKGSEAIVNSFLNLLEKDEKLEIVDQEYDALKFKKIIKFENISFKFDKNLPNIISKFNFEIMVGEKIAIKGKTGSGKSTLANIVAGLISPTQGKILVDGIEINSENLKNWQKNIAIVPQTVFLNDATVLENIAIAQNFSSIDLEKAKNSAELAQINTFIQSLPNKYMEEVGERGVRFSGGQRQRMGIARALYRNVKVIILDEPTNALDSKTEKLVMDSISKISKDITVLMISHSNESLKYFNKIIDLDKLN
jgi:ABC-type bacteriocin/lantibiotic exporter with double-glycine peptidase domain